MPNSLIDLHFHSYYSDGRASPGEILHYAADIGLKTVALTDHDTLAGLPEAQNVAGHLGLELIPAIELTTRWDDEYPTLEAEHGERDIDVLAYFINPLDPGFQSFVQAASEDILERIEQACLRLTQSGILITINDLLQENTRCPGMLQVLSVLQRKGFAENRSEAMDIAYRAYRQSAPSRHTLSETVRAIHAAGGAAVLAHPISIDLGHGWIGDSETDWLSGIGLDGMEVMHPRLNPAARQHFMDLAQRFHLIVTGGSDDHGWPSGFPRLGSEPVSYETVHALRNAAQKYHSHL